ncbi:MAG: LCP family protein, partial [Anaerolineae bacterium]
MHSREKEESRSNWKVAVKRTALAFLFLIFAAGGLLAGVRISMTGGEVTVAGRKISFPNFGPKPFGGRESFTILVLGLDQKSKFDEHAPQRSDSIMLVLVDLANKKVSGISIPRDSRVEIPGRGHLDKINAAYAYGFAPLSIEAVKNLTGISPDYYVVADTAGFEKMVDLLGGVDLYVEKDMHYDDNWQDLHIHLKKGYQHLNGK